MSGPATITFLVGFLILIAGLFAVIVERTNERDEARLTLTNERAVAKQRIADAERRANAAEVGERIAQDLLEQYRRDARVVVPIKLAPVSVSEDEIGRVIPLQRTPESAEVSDFTWPRIARGVWIEGLENGENA